MKKVRPPIVTVLGHVDHGKTTLLDALRKTSVARKEAGGITQSTGASVVTTKEGKKITFIDTPGHAAFAEMRSRGAQLADIALLVVAADDGVKPQTIEALKYIKEAKIPFIVVISKIDISPSIVPIKGQLEKEGVLFEGRGGDTPLVALSAKTKKGIDELIEMITLVSEVNEIKADEGGELEAIVVETGKDTRGPTASVVVREGTLSVRDEILMDGIECRVRGLFNYEGKSVKKVLPGEPALVLGLKELPPVGTKVTSLKGGETKKDEVIKKDAKQSSVEEGQIAVVLKARSAGALEALLVNLPKDVVVVNSGVGPVNESDV
ncbi:MAG: GTP-binding protein, partial [Patescibacteria group bacterium]